MRHWVLSSVTAVLLLQVVNHVLEAAQGRGKFDSYFPSSFLSGSSGFASSLNVSTRRLRFVASKEKGG